MKSYPKTAMKDMANEMEDDAAEGVVEYAVGEEPTLVLETPPEGLQEALKGGPVKLEITADLNPTEGEGPLELSIKSVKLVGKAEVEDVEEEQPRSIAEMAKDMGDEEMA